MTSNDLQSALAGMENSAGILQCAMNLTTAIQGRFNSIGGCPEATNLVVEALVATAAFAKSHPTKEPVVEHDEHEQSHVE